MQKSILSWALERLSSIMVVTSSIRSSRPSYPLKRYIEPLTSTKNHSFFLCFLLEAKCGLLLSPRCLKTDRSPLKASTNLVSSRSPEVLCLIHARSLPLLSVHTRKRVSHNTVGCWLALRATYGDSAQCCVVGRFVRQPLLDTIGTGRADGASCQSP